MAAKKPNRKQNRKPKVLTLGDVGVPQVTYHQPSEIPLVNATDRFAFLDWEDIHEAIIDKRVVALTCEPGEANTVMRHLYQRFHDLDECATVPMESRYDAVGRRLFVYSLLRDWGKVQKAG